MTKLQRALSDAFIDLDSTVPPVAMTNEVSRFIGRIRDALMSVETPAQTKHRSERVLARMCKRR